MQKHYGFTVMALMLLVLTGCYEPVSGKLGQTDGLGLMVASERHDIRVAVAKPNLAATVANHAAECVKPGCLVLSKWTQADDYRTRGSVKMLVADSQLEGLMKRLATTPAKITTHAVQSGGAQTAPDLQARMSALVNLRDSLQKHAVASPLSPLEAAATERRLARLQGDIETLGYLQKNSAALGLLTGNENATEAAETNENTNMPTAVAYVHVRYQTAQGPELDMAPVHEAVASAKQAVVTSTAAMITFAAQTLPWLPLAIIAMWLLSIVFKSKVKIKTVPTAPASGFVASPAAPAPAAPAAKAAPAAAPQQAPQPAKQADPAPKKKKLLGGLLKKKSDKDGGE